MIFKINKDYTHTSIGGLIQYHENKVAEGVATKDPCLATISMKNRHDIEIQMREHMSLYCPRKRKKHFHQISCNFNTRDEQLTEVDKQSIVSEYMEGMGYNKTLHVAYRHSDKEHDHWHIIATAADTEGRLIECRDDFHKSARITRLLENKYGLEILNEQGENKSITEAQLKKDNYRYARALDTYFSSSESIDPCFELAKSGNGEKLNNDELRNLYAKNNQLDAFRNMIRMLAKARLISRSKADEIRNRIKIIKTESSKIASFIKLFNEHKFYARFVQADHEIHYGYDGMYFKAHQLGKEFTARGLMSFWNQKKGIDQPLEKEIPRDFADVKGFVKKRVQFHINYSESFEELSERLQSKDNIVAHLKMKTDGKAMLSFEHEGFKIKSSAINLQYDKILGRLNENKNQTQQLLKSNPILQQRLGNHYQTPYRPKQPIKVLKTLNNIADRDASEADYERKRKYDKGMGM